MDDSRLNEIERAAKEATPGPWHLDDEARDGYSGVIVTDDGDSLVHVEAIGSHAQWVGTQDFITLCNPATVLELAAALREARAIADDAKSSIEQLCRVRDDLRRKLVDAENARLTIERDLSWAQEINATRDALAERAEAAEAEAARWKAVAEGRPAVEEVAALRKSATELCNRIDREGGHGYAVHALAESLRAHAAKGGGGR